MTSLEIYKLKRYYLLRENIPRMILSRIGSNNIVYGARAINIQVPKFLKFPTFDFDIFSPNPKEDAERIKSVLNKILKENDFYVIPAKHFGTFKVKSFIDGKTYADFTKLSESMPFKSIYNVNYADIRFIAKTMKESLHNNNADYRKNKDIDSLNRITVALSMKNL